MASLHQPVALLLTLGLLAACGGERSRAGTATDTTGVAVRPDSAAMPTAVAPDTTRKAGATSRADTGVKRALARDTGKKLVAAEARTTRDTGAGGTPQAARDTTRAQKAESTKSAAAPAPAPTPQQQDTTSAPAEAPLRDAYHQAPRDTVSQAVYDGWKQFNLNCARCHGEDVLGTTIAPHLIVSLKPDGPINTKELFMQTVCAGRPEKGMPAWCALGLDMDKINDIYLYVKGRSDAKIGPGRPAVRKEG
jgi:mono/diheme cytochrome c family protein